MLIACSSTSRIVYLTLYYDTYSTLCSSPSQITYALKHMFYVNAPSHAGNKTL